MQDRHLREGKSPKGVKIPLSLAVYSFLFYTNVGNFLNRIDY